MSEETTPTVTTQPDPPAPPPDADNPAIIDAHKTFAITLVSAALFIGAIAVLIL